MCECVYAERLLTMNFCLISYQMEEGRALDEHLQLRNVSLEELKVMSFQDIAVKLKITVEQAIQI